MIMKHYEILWNVMKCYVMTCYESIRKINKHCEMMVWYDNMMDIMNVCMSQWMNDTYIILYLLLTLPGNT